MDALVDLHRRLTDNHFDALFRLRVRERKLVQECAFFLVPLPIGRDKLTPRRGINPPAGNDIFAPREGFLGLRIKMPEQRCPAAEKDG